MKHILLGLSILCGCVLPLFAAHPSAKGISYTYPKEYSQWQNAFFGGNGKTGIILFGNPESETIVFTSRDFNFPSASERSFAKVDKDTVEKISRLCAEGKFKEANDLAVSSSRWRDGGEGGRHPGFAVKIDVDTEDSVSDYSRICDYSTGEITVEWKDGRGLWRRKGFVSRQDDYAVFHISHDGKDFSGSVSLDLPGGAHFPDGMSGHVGRFGENAIGIDVNYPAPMTAKGFSGLVCAAGKGGRLFVRNDSLFVEGARELTLIVNTGKFDNGKSCQAELYERVRNIGIDYDALFSAHKKIHEEIYDRVQIDFGADQYSRNLPNETLLKMQKESAMPVPALLERLFYAGRYHFLASGNSTTPPDLLGIWTGDCEVGWGGFYHLDANLNLQVSSGNTCAMPEVMEGYFNLNEVWAKDFERNAADLLGCRGLLACGNTPGLSSGLMASINEFYPYHYATGEEAWLLYPFWEYYLVSGDTSFLRDRLFPLLVKMGEFYEDFLRYKDAEGKYIFAGSVSPENQPSNLGVSLLNNSAFDVAGARWALSTLVKSCDILALYQDKGGKREKWQEILMSLPDYKVNSDGAVKEWGWDNLDDHYHHRHSSHLMMVWPYREVSLLKKNGLFDAVSKSQEMRDRYDYENAGHGYLHAALVAAGLGRKESFSSKLDNLLRRDFFFDGLVSSHYPNYGVFCTDVCNSLPGLLTEMIVGSDEDGIVLLPVLVDSLPKGKLSGLKTRCGATIENLEWNLEEGTVTAWLSSEYRKEIKISIGNGLPKTISVCPTLYKYVFRIS